MCGICGILDLKGQDRIDNSIIMKMVDKLLHRGPDGKDTYLDRNIALGFTRLSIIDLSGGMQPIKNEDGSIVLICNGEIFNYIELREELMLRGHKFRTNSDVEVIIHLYEEEDIGFLNKLNGQFSFAIYDSKKQQLLCVRDHFGITPFHYTICDDFLIFGSEIKAILEHPKVIREVDLVGLDQIITLPGLVSPRTMFKNIRSLENGHCLVVKAYDNTIRDIEYWDLIYPEIDNVGYTKSINYYVEKLDELITNSVRLRMRADVPTGLYISGGLDSSIIASKAMQITPNIRRHSFSIDFNEKRISEFKYQNIMQQHINSIHHNKLFLFTDIGERLQKAVYYCECALKETYNTASLALSETANQNNIKVILTGEGSDEFFAGYVGYKFDKLRQKNKVTTDHDINHEKAMRKKLWGDEDFVYEKEYFSYDKIKRNLYSSSVQEVFEEFNCLNNYIIKKERLHNRDVIHKRSYIDFKLRLADHLISDHGDRMAYANSIEARYPFLDKELVEFVAMIPPKYKLHDFEEKYILKRMAKNLVPHEIIKREKFAFVAPGSPYLLKRNIEYINDILSYDTVKRQGYLNPDMIEKLKKEYIHQDFKLNLPFDSDLLIIAITFGIFLEQFRMPNFN